VIGGEIGRRKRNSKTTLMARRGAMFGRSGYA
jgi:hypothetical protein